VQQKMSVILR